MICLTERSCDFADHERHGFKAFVARDLFEIRTDILNKRLYQPFVARRIRQIGFALHPCHALYARSIPVLLELFANGGDIVDKALVEYAHRTVLRVYGLIAPFRAGIPVPPLVVFSA